MYFQIDDSLLLVETGRMKKEGESPDLNH